MGTRRIRIIRRIIFIILISMQFLNAGFQIKTIPESWAKFFDGLNDDQKIVRNEILGPTWSPRKSNLSKSNILEQNLLEHLQTWRPHVDKHGLLLLELHCLDPKIIAKNIGLTGSTAYESTHVYSDQYIVNIECFLRLAIESGLTPVEKYQLIFPDNELGNISINLFK